MFTLQKNPEKADFKRTGKSEISNKEILKRTKLLQSLSSLRCVRVWVWM